MSASVKDLFKTWLYIGLVSFGGPAAQIALIHRIIVDEKKWLNEHEFLNALNFCMLLPGPEAMQLATYCGWRQRGFIGGLISGGLFVLPGAVLIAILATLYVEYANLHYVQIGFLGVKAAVIVVVLQALIRISGKALISPQHYIIAGLSFVLIFFFDLPYPIIILMAILSGLIFPYQDIESKPAKTIKVDNSHLLRTLLFGLTIWFFPIAILYLTTGYNMLLDIALFFSKLAVVSFGGAYAVLTYMTQTIVQDYGWLNTNQMIDALGLAETTPGPLILVTEFTAYVATHQVHGTGYAILAAILTLWVTFIPCFIWIFLGAPYLSWLQHKARFKKALQNITAAVVGVMLNLSLWFSISVYFGQISNNNQIMSHLNTSAAVAQLDYIALFISLVAAYLIFWRKTSILLTLAICIVTTLTIDIMLVNY